MRILPIYTVFPSQIYRSQDMIVNSVGSVRLEKSYRDVNNPIQVEPAAKLYLSPEAMMILYESRK